jgi:hypothetical protein
VAIENFGQNFLCKERELLIAILDRNNTDRKIKSKYLPAHNVGRITKSAGLRLIWICIKHSQTDPAL